MKRTHHCNLLRKKDVGSTVTLVGWVDAIRDHGGIFFIDLRDRKGKTQLVFDPSMNQEFNEKFHTLKPESVIEVSGQVKARTEETVNKDLDTGEIEVVVEKLHIYNISETIPFPLEDEKASKVNEEIRLKYRYLDLRRKKSYEHLKIRAKAAKAVREYLSDEDFLEVEMPTLF